MVQQKDGDEMIGWKDGQKKDGIVSQMKNGMVGWMEDGVVRWKDRQMMG